MLKIGPYQNVPKKPHMNTYILGVSAYYHDSAAALIKDGRIEAAAQEERFTRKKFDAGFPIHAVRYCLEQGGITLADLKYFVFYDKPLVKFERLLGALVVFTSGTAIAPFIYTLF